MGHPPELTRYEARGTVVHGGAARLESSGFDVAFDGSADRDTTLPSPAELLCASLCACLLKNVERFSRRLPFRYESARVHVEAERESAPPRIVRMRYRLEIVTDEPARRVELLHKNVRKFGTISGTLSAACELDGEIVAIAPSAE